MSLNDTDTVEVDSFLPQEESKETQERNDRPMPTDRGWAWVILAGAVLTMMIIIGGHRTSGILFIEFQERFHSSSADTSLVSTILNVIFCIVAPVAMTVGVKMTSCSSMVLVGTVLLCSSYICTAFVKDIRMLILTHGVLQGVGMACIETPTVSIVTKYFVKRRGLANSIAAAGGSSGGLIIPPLVTALFIQYGYRGALIILAAIQLHICVAAAIYRHYNHFTKPARPISTIPQDNTKKAKSPLRVLIDLFDFKLFREPLFLLYQLAFGLLTSAKLVCMFFVAPYAHEAGIGIADIATLLVIFNATDMCSRLGLGFVSDIGKCRRSTIVSVCALVLSLITNFARYFSNFWLFVPFALIAGFSGSSFSSLNAAIIADYLPLKYLDSTLGFAMFSMGATCGLCLYVGGVLRDITGSYVATLHLSGALAFVGGAIMASLPLVEKWKKVQR